LDLLSCVLQSCLNIHIFKTEFLVVAI
jgi:hypothetical protein